MSCTWSSRVSDPQGIWYARCPAGGGNPSPSLGRRENWTGADGKTPGPERIDQGEGIEFGDLVTDDRGRPWILYSRTIRTPGENIYLAQDKGHRYSRRARRPALQLWAASPKGGDWVRQPLTQPGDFEAPAADLDRSGTLHLTSSRKGFNFLFYHQFPNFSQDFDRRHDFTSSASLCSLVRNRICRLQCHRLGPAGPGGLGKGGASGPVRLFRRRELDRPRTALESGAQPPPHTRSRPIRRGVGLLDQHDEEPYLLLPVAGIPVRRPLRSTNRRRRSGFPRRDDPRAVPESLPHRGKGNGRAYGGSGHGSGHPGAAKAASSSTP